MMKKTILAATLGAALLASTGLASAAGNTWYLGANVGSSSTDLNGSDFDSAYRSLGLTATTSADDNDTGYKLFAGYKFNDWIALEFGYVDLGKFSFNSTITAPAAFAGTVNGEIRVKDGIFVDAVGTLPLSNGFSLFGRLGAYSAKTSVSASGRAGALTESDRTSDLHWGVGAGYDFNKNVGLRLEWERFQKVGGNSVGKQDVDLASIGIVYRFQ